MHKLAKGLKKKKKQKKGKKGAEEDEFDPEELERYRRERAEAQQRAAESGDPGAAEPNADSAAAGSDEWKKFEALTAGVDSILKKSQGDLDRIKSTSFFQRKAPLEDPKVANAQNDKKKAKRWVGFDESGNPIGEKSPEEEEKPVNDVSDGFVEIPDDEDDQEDSAEEDIFDTTYVDVLQNIDVQLAYIPESPTQEELGDDPFDTTSADKVLKTVDKRGNKLVSLGNAVEVLSGRIDHVSTCKISRPRKVKTQNDLLLGDFDESEQLDSLPSTGVVESAVVEKTLLDDDSDLPDIPVDLTKLPPVLPRPVTPETNATTTFKLDSDPVDISEFEVLREKTILEEIPDLDDTEFDLSTTSETPLKLEEADDPFSAKESEENKFQSEIIEASFEAATFVNEEDPFDTTFAENLLPGKTELKCIEKELEDLPISEVAISLTDPAGLSRDYETGLIKNADDQDGDIFDTDASSTIQKDLLGGSVTDLSQLVDQPIAPIEEITYVDPFDTSGVVELPPGKTELKFLERELLGEVENAEPLSDDDFDPRGDETPVKSAPSRPPAPPKVIKPSPPNFEVTFGDADDAVVPQQGRKPSRPEELGLAAPVKSVAFDLPTPSQRPDLLKTSEEEKSIPSKPLTPYSQRSFEEVLSEDEPGDEADIDPFDTSFVAKVAPGKKELKLIESELLKRDSQLSHSLSDHDFNPRAEGAEINQGRRFSDFSATTARPKSLKIVGVSTSLIEESEEQQKSVFEVNIEAHNKKAKPRRQESLLDAEFKVDAKPLTPRIEGTVTIQEKDILYTDPFDTSIIGNILPGKAELRILESELSEIPEQLPSKKLCNEQNFDPELSVEDDFDPRAGEPEKPQDFLGLSGRDTGVKVLTPFQSREFPEEEDIDPFDTSFATIGPGKTELKLLESELIEKCSFKMESKGGNPFLMDDYDDQTDVAGNQQASNPFLQDFGPATASGGGENPFLNFGVDPGYQPPSTIDSNNPFASFGVESTAPSSLFGVETSSVTAFPMDMQSNDIYGGENTDLFGQAEPEPQKPLDQETDLFGSPKETSKTSPVMIVQTGYPAEVLEPKNGKPPPMRPPPPRPQPPPPPSSQTTKTKDLILSVTGAMDATSNHLLDRLQATRTPSPTLMHSPSPTPEHSFADLLDVDGNVPELAQDDSKPETNLRNSDIMDLFDAPNLDNIPTSASDMIFSAPKTEPTLFSSTETSVITRVTSTQENPFADVETEVPQGDAIHTSDYPTESAATAVEKRLSISSETPFSANSPFTASDFIQDIASADFSSTAETTFSDTIGAQLTSSTFSMLDQAPTMMTTAEPLTESFVSSTASAFGIIEPLYTETVPGVNTTSAPFSAQQDTTTFASDLLGDLSQSEREPSLVSTSPELASEFPSSGVYQTEGLDDFSATAKVIESTGDAFDAFASKFDKAAEPEPPGESFFDAFGAGQTAMDTSSDVWGDSSVAGSETATGFGENEGFDSFLSMTAPPQDNKAKRTESVDSDEAPDFSIFIKPKEGDQLTATEGGPVPVIAPPPRSPQNSAYADSSPRFNPFDKSAGFAQEAALPLETAQAGEMTRTDSQETPPTPLFDEDVSQPLEDFPRVTYIGDGWEMQLRQPNKKKITGQRFWKKIFVKLVYQGDNPVLQLFNGKDDKDPFQELPLQACYSVSDIGAQQFDQYGKIFTVKLQYIFYKERPGVRPGQVTKAERITNKLSQFAAYAIQGDYQGVKEFGSDLKKLGLPVEHAPQISQLFKIGSQCYEDMKQFSNAVEEALFRLPAHRDRALNYKMEEVQITVVDELYVEQSAEGHVDKQIARVRLFFLGFLSGMPDVELGINDMWRQGKEVVGRHDIIPVVTEEWIRLENVEFHSCVQQDEYERSRIIKFKPPDACYIELMRFRVRPPKNRELPLQLKAVMCVTGNKVELRADILVPGFASRKLGQVPCEDVMVRFPIPECWIYLFRVEKHFRYGSVKSAHRRTGKIKGIERFLGAVDTLEPQLMEVTSGQAKYEHQHRAIVWRMPRLPKEGQGAYTTHQLVCRMALTSYDQIPEQLAEYCYVEFTMPATQVSHTTARSVSLQNSDSDNPPEKYVRNLSRHEYRVGIEHTQGEGPGAYVTATLSKKIPEATPEVHNEFPEQPPESDSDSSD
ncbi:protein stoned-B-like [Neodiprion fabricii]|uniref:protein stoned-B-like n=1 Tax=Neodiprion fabricii TaxID=2872261 RepID=UPI001ED90B26|nr:protein stoned-B-like [Neodiprion fabricii]